MKSVSLGDERGRFPFEQVALGASLTRASLEQPLGDSAEVPHPQASGWAGGGSGSGCPCPARWHPRSTRWFPLGRGQPAASTNVPTGTKSGASIPGLGPEVMPGSVRLLREDL